MIEQETTEICELTADELEAVAGGTPKLHEAACRGKHFSEVVIAGGTGEGGLLGTVVAGAVSGGSGAVT
jgi:hypothetical protein